MARKGVVKRDIVGKRFGSLTVLDAYIQVPRGDKQCSYTKWLCRCDCGAERYVCRNQILNNKTHYCPTCRPKGRRNEKLYHVYYGIKQRCNNQKNPSYCKYGGQGITICTEWDSDYCAFKEWAYKNGYREGLTIDRIDPTKNYSPDNCRWISLSENSARANVGRHKNKSKLTDVYAISPDGDKIVITNISKFSEDHGLNYSCVSAVLHGRMKNNYYGWVFHSNKTVA